MTTTQRDKEFARVAARKATLSEEERDRLERREIESQLTAIEGGDAEMTEDFHQKLIDYGYITNESPRNGAPVPGETVLHKDVTQEKLPVTGSGSGGADVPGDPALDDAYLRALSALQAAKQQTPTYKGTYDGKLDEIYREIVGREPFRYDAAEDAMYAQYAETARRNGERAMRDTMGQAASMTGGYGNSYAASVGNQAYLDYMEDVNRMLPEFYGIARDAYDAEGDRMAAEYALTSDLAADEYGRYLDEMDEHHRLLDDLREEANDAYDKAADAQKTAYEREMDAYDRMVAQITEHGYVPTEGELETLGMSAEEANGYYETYLNTAKETVPKKDGFGGTTRVEAVAYMRKKGVPEQIAEMLISEEDWNAAKKNGSTAYEVIAYDSYAEFLADAVADAIEQYAK